jgi:hypothetical protein
MLNEEIPREMPVNEEVEDVKATWLDVLLVRENDT